MEIRINAKAIELYDEDGKVATVKTGRVKVIHPEGGVDQASFSCVSCGEELTVLDGQRVNTGNSRNQAVYNYDRDNRWTLHHWDC